MSFELEVILIFAALSVGLGVVVGLWLNRLLEGRVEMP